MTDSATTDATRLPLTSADVLGEREERLKELFPEAFVEGEIDFDRLRNALGDFVGEGRERYGLSWAGKADAIRAIQAPSVGTLVPCPDESVNFDTTENLFIEGDNLEVLKLLQKSYYGKVKMIYIDPPYNTGGEFIYPDNFREGLEEYLRYSGQVGEGGVRLSTNAETSGRFHSKWLDMMYPRLFLARTLLREDGVIFVSIDDHEQHNLRLLMDEVFGSENFVANIIWQKKYAKQNDATWFSTSHDHILLYARNKGAWTPHKLIRTPEQLKGYKNPDNDPRGLWQSVVYTCNKTREERPNLYYPITHPTTGAEVLPSPTRVWGYEPDTHKKHIEEGRMWWGMNNEKEKPRLKSYLSEVGKGLVPDTLWLREDVGDNQDAKRAILELFESAPFETPKPPSLIERMLEVSTKPDQADIVLDFFAGSCTTAEAVLNLQSRDRGNRRFVMVQLPEPCDAGSNASNNGFSTVAEIGKERIRRVINRTKSSDDAAAEERQSELPGMAEDLQPIDLGFRCLKLTSSNFKIWDGTEEFSPEALQEQLELFADHVLPDRPELAILYELMLKAGLPLTAAIDEKTVAEHKVYLIAEGLLAISLAKALSQECLRGIIELSPQRVICLDAAFGGNDQLKTNTVLEMKSHGIEFRTV